MFRLKLTHNYHHLKKVLIISACLFCQIIAFAQFETDSLLSIGQRAINSQDYIIAMHYINQAINAKPNIPVSYLLRAESKINLGDFQGADEDCSKAIELNPYIPYAYYARGYVRQKLNFVPEAIKDFTEALKYSPNNKSYLLIRAESYEMIKNYVDASSDIALCVRLNPKESNLLYDLGRIQLELKDTVAAENTYTRFIETDSTRYYSWSARAMLRMLKDDTEGALNDYNQAIKHKSTYAGDYINRGILNNERKNYKQALQDYDNAIKLDKSEFLGYYNRGLIRVTLGDNNRALADFTTAIRLDTTNMEVRWKKALLELTLKNYKNSIADYKIVLAKYPYFVPALQGIAEAEDALGNVKSAFKYRQLASNIESNKEFYKQKSKATIVATNKMAAGQKITTGKNTALFNRYDNLNTTDSGSNQQNNDNSIRGNVQDNYTDVVNERNFILTYYAKNSEIRRTNVYYPLIEQYNDKKLISSVLKITNNELALTGELVNSHFNLITDISKRIADDVNNPDLYFNRAIEFALVLNQKSAIDDLNKTIELRPDFMPAYFCRANLRYQLDESLKLNANTVDQVYKVNSAQLPNDSQYRFNLEMILHDLDKVTELCPDFSFAYFNKANLLCTQRDFKTAITNYTKAIAIDHDFAEAYFNRGLTYLFIGEDTKGLADLSKAGELGIYKAYNLIQRFKK